MRPYLQRFPALYATVNVLALFGLWYLGNTQRAKFDAMRHQAGLDSGGRSIADNVVKAIDFGGPVVLLAGAAFAVVSIIAAVKAMKRPH